MKAKFSLFLVLISCLISFPAIAGEYEDAVTAHDNRDYKTAFSTFSKLADENHAGAQFYLGHMYRHSESVKSSKKKTAKWLQKAAAQGNDDARVTLGFLYFSGEGVPKSQEKAAALYKLASANGHVAGRYQLAQMYWYGWGIKEDRQKAFNLYSQVNRMRGLNSHLFFIENTDAGEEIDQLKRKYGWLEETFTAEQAAKMKIEKEKQQQKQDLYVANKAAQIKAEALAAGAIEEGLLAYQAKDYQRAYPILAAHAKDGHVEAQTRLGIMFLTGLGVEKNDDTAGHWFDQAQQSGSPEAQYYYALLAYNQRIKVGHFIGSQKRTYGLRVMHDLERAGYQPATTFLQNVRLKNAKQEQLALEQQAKFEEKWRLEAEEEARRAEHRRKYGRKTITNCDGPRPSDAPPVPAGYYCDRRSGSPTYGDYVRRN